MFHRPSRNDIVASEACSLPFMTPVGRVWADQIGRQIADLLSVLRDLGARHGVLVMSTVHMGGGANSTGPSDAAQADMTDISEMYREHAVSMYRTALSVVRDHALAEDVVQDSIVKAWRKLDTYRGEASMRTWLLTITHNTAVSTLRRIRDTPRDPERMPDSETAGPESGLVGDMFLEAFERALFDLDETSRTTVALRELDGLSYEEISHILGLPLPTVKTRLFRARRHLARELAGWSSQ